MTNKKVTVVEVAEAAGLSVASVSRALSGSRPVTPEVAELVKNAAASLGYEPDKLARSLRMGKTSTVGLVVPDLASPFFPLLAYGVEKALDSQGLSMIVMNADNDPKRERHCIEELISRRIDALLISPTHRIESKSAVENAASRIPVVQIDRYATSRVASIVTDPRRTVQLAYEHMRQRGGDAFAFIGATSASSAAHDRLSEYRIAMKEHSPPSGERLIVGEFSFDWGHEAGRRVIEQWPELNAIICANDLIALGVIHGLQECGRSVPESVMVTGCDDTFFSTVSRPSVTSVAQPITEIATLAVAALRDGTILPTRTAVAPELRVRQSTG
ncbi:MAG: LacI family DNA-binding transcriptional regulator [Arthrobacter sp.]